MTEIPLKIVVWKEGAQYVAWCLNNAISSFEGTKKEAMESLKEVLELYCGDKLVLDVPKVEQPSIVPFTFAHV